MVSRGKNLSPEVKHVAESARALLKLEVVGTGTKIDDYL